MDPRVGKHAKVKTTISSVYAGKTGVIQELDSTANGDTVFILAFGTDRLGYLEEELTFPKE